MKKNFSFILFMVLMFVSILSGCSKNEINLEIIGQTTMLVGETQELEVYCNEDKIDPSLITYDSLDKNILTADENGNVTALATGTTFIAVYYKDASETIEITVHEEKANSLNNFKVFHQDNNHIILFSLLNSNGEYIKSSGFIEIQIINEFNIELYNKTASYSINDFSIWKTTQLGSVINEYLACSIYINDSELLKSETGFGTIKITIHDKNKAFEQKCFEISSIPYDITLEFKKTSGTFYYYNYKGTQILSYTTVSNAEVRYEKAYDNRIYITIKVYCVCNYLASNYSWSSVGYKIYDNNKSIVDSGKINKQVSSGDSWIGTKNLYLDARNYTIELCNPD